MSGESCMQKDCNSSSQVSEMGLVNNIVVYKNLDQVWKALTLGAIKDFPEVKRLVDLTKQVGLVEYISTGVVKYNIPKKEANHNDNPFVVIEGLDGTGKTTLVKYLSSKLHMEKMSTPPTKMHFEFGAVRDFFDKQPEPIRRAYYSLGNYIAATDILKVNRPVIMDRYWHSTAAYALAHQLKTGKSIQDSDLVWPEDLMKPDIVLFLTISEHERLRRHANRKNFTNTPEEQTLADDKVFRRNLIQLYVTIKGPQVISVNVDGKYQETKQKVIQAITKALPGLERQAATDNL